MTTTRRSTVAAPERKVLRESRGIQVRDDVSDSQIVVVQVRGNAVLAEYKYTPGRIETWSNAFAHASGFANGWTARDKYQNGF